MNKKIALFVAYAFVLGQVFTPAIANAQSDNTSNAKVVVSDDLQAQRAGKSSQETSCVYQKQTGRKEGRGCSG